MYNYLVTFDLHFDNEEQNKYYSEVEEYLKTLKKYVKPTNNVYLVASDSDNYAEIRDEIIRICGRDCFVLIVGLNGKYASFNSNDINSKIRNFYAK